jgi:mannose-6-phosphate isomerase-like protein (cupin superfamily)
MAEQRKLKVVRPGEGRTVHVVGDTYRFLAVGGDTDRGYFLMEATTPPGGGPPLHYHTREEEGFYILDGEFEFAADGETVRAGPGTFLTLPKLSRHMLKNVGDRPGRMLVLCAPAGIEDFFAAGDGQGSEELVAAAARHGIHIIPPEG